METGFRLLLLVMTMMMMMETSQAGQSLHFSISSI